MSVAVVGTGLRDLQPPENTSHVMTVSKSPKPEMTSPNADAVTSEGLVDDVTAAGGRRNSGEVKHCYNNCAWLSAIRYR